MKTGITSERLRELVSYDAETGRFFRKSRRKGVTLGAEAGCIGSDGYVVFNVDNTRYLAHRLAWLYVTGSWPEGQIDHINGNRSDNRFVNLRDVPQSINMQNLRAAQRSKKSCNLLGVYFNKKDKFWYSQIKINGKNKSLGCFNDAAKAQAAYVDAKRRLHEGCTI